MNPSDFDVNYKGTHKATVPTRPIHRSQVRCLAPKEACVHFQLGKVRRLCWITSWWCFSQIAFLHGKNIVVQCWNKMKQANQRSAWCMIAIIGSNSFGMLRGCRLLTCPVSFAQRLTPGRINSVCVCLSLASKLTITAPSSHLHLTLVLFVVGWDVE